MKRRTFLKSSLATAAVTPVALGQLTARASSPLRLLGQLKPLDQNDKILILIQLFGGNDGLNTIVPANDSNYYTLRPNIGIQKNYLINRGGSDGFYMNSGLGAGNKQGFAGMFDSGRLAILRGIGYTPPNLSHFRSTDIWLSGINDSNANDVLSTGWLGRFLEQQYPNFPSQLPTDPLAINFGGFSLALMGQQGNMGIVVNNPSLQAGGLSSTDNSLDANASGTRYATEYAFVQSVAEMSSSYATRVQNAYASGLKSLQGNYGGDSLGQQMKSIAALIAGGLNTRVYVAGMGGFDTHVQQAFPDGTGGGYQTALLGQLADAVAQFQSDMLNQGSSVADRVIGLTVSEFGRRPHDNNSNGTDHGAASVQFAFGTRINGAVFGDPPDLANLDANGDLDVQIDFRSVYQTILTDWFGMSRMDALTVLDNQNDLDPPLGGLIKSSPNAVTPDSRQLALSLSVFPNPIVSSTTIAIELPKASYTKIELVSLDGRSVQSILARTLTAGSYSIPLEPDVPSGAYLLSMQTSAGRISKVVEVLK